LLLPLRLPLHTSRQHENANQHKLRLRSFLQPFVPESLSELHEGINKNTKIGNHAKHDQPFFGIRPPPVDRGPLGVFDETREGLGKG
jgi:hypothetical protein